MTTILNGADASALFGWIIAFAGGRALIGRPGQGTGSHGEDLSRRLDPVYDLSIAVQPVRGPDGSPAMQRNMSAVPVMFLSSLRWLDLGPGATCIHVEDLSRGEREQLRRAVVVAEDIVRGMRAADAGIAVARTVPPMVKP
jgi:hypothetical protein